MPASATHMMILDQIIEKIKVENSEIGRILEENRAMAYIGSLGPDFLFWGPDMCNEYKDLLYFIFDFYDNFIQPVIEFYETYIEPLVELIAKPIELIINTVDEILFCGALGDLSEALDDLGDRIINFAINSLLALGTDCVNLFEIWTPPIQEGYKEEEWYWFDMLHYRFTGDFAKNLIELAESEGEIAYAFGYLTHIAGDVTGHAYVNEIVGGPYRAHNRRHHIVENFMDVWTYDHYKGVELIGAKLHRLMPGGLTLDNMGTLRTILDVVPDPPKSLESLFSMFEDGLRRTYQDKEHPLRIENEFFTSKDISSAYWINLAFLKLSTDSKIPPIEPPTDDVLEEINRLWSELLKDLGEPPVPPGAPDLCWSFWSDSCDFSWDAVNDFFRFLADSIRYLAQSLLWVAELLWDLVRLGMCALTQTVVTEIKAILWIIQYNLSALTQTFRDALVIAGIALPEIDYVKNSPLGRQFTKIETQGYLVNEAPSILRESSETGKGYPHRQLESSLIGGLLLPLDTHLEYPNSVLERPLTLDGPYMLRSSPLSFIAEAEIDDNVLEDFESACSPEETRNIEFNALNSGRKIGNAVDYASMLIRKAHEYWTGGEEELFIPNWNLDSDRGYGYKCWYQDDPRNLAPNSTNDINGHYFGGDLFQQLRCNRDKINKNLELYPDFVINRFSNEKINVKVVLNTGKNLQFTIETQNSCINTIKRRENESPTIRAQIEEDTFRNIMESSDKIQAAMDAIEQGEIEFVGVGLKNRVKLNLIQGILKSYGFISGLFGQR